MSVYLTHEAMCPKCFRDDSLQVVYTGSAHLTSNGSEDVGDHEWDSDTTCHCGACGHSGKLETFDVEHCPMETAACLWEAFLSGYADNAERNGGMAASRTAVIELREKCELWYNYALTLGYGEPFDWEWCPWFLSQNIDGNGVICELDFDDMKKDVKELCE